MLFEPIIRDTLRTYSWGQFRRDALAGLIVGIVALPLAIAFGIASGVSPEKGIFTAVIAGLVISALGGSRVQIGGPTGAFIVIVYGIVQQYGVTGLIIATFIAGLMLIAMGLAKLGTVIQYIPYPLIVGFTSGIALVILSSQIRDLLGMRLAVVPADFVEKVRALGEHFGTLNGWACGIAGVTVLITFFWGRVTHRIPGSLVAIVTTTVVVSVFHLPVETIGSRFGRISPSFPMPVLPHLDVATMRKMVQPAFTIALLGGIESLLSAVVADGMIGGSHRSNTELMAQGMANIASSLFGGIPATGAIARTATNVRNGGRTPMAGMIHSIVLLLIMLFVGRWAALIPMATLAGILVVVAYNMSEWENFIAILKGSWSDRAVLLTTFLLTVLVDLTVAIEIGLVLAAFLFLRQMVQSSSVGPWEGTAMKGDGTGLPLPGSVEVFEIRGPLFFGAVYSFKEAMRSVERAPKVLILRMRQVPVIDASGIRALREMQRDFHRRGTRLVLSEVTSPGVIKSLKDARLLFAIGKANVVESFEEAVKRAGELVGHYQK